jgi:hypothetical protein
MVRCLVRVSQVQLPRSFHERRTTGYLPSSGKSGMSDRTKEQRAAANDTATSPERPHRQDSNRAGSHVADEVTQ